MGGAVHRDIDFGCLRRRGGGFAKRKGDLRRGQLLALYALDGAETQHIAGPGGEVACCQPGVLRAVGECPACVGSRGQAGPNAGGAGCAGGKGYCARTARARWRPQGCLAAVGLLREKDEGRIHGRLAELDAHLPLHAEGRPQQHIAHAHRKIADNGRVARQVDGGLADGDAAPRGRLAAGDNLRRSELLGVVVGQPVDGQADTRSAEKEVGWIKADGEHRAGGGIRIEGVGEVDEAHDRRATIRIGGDAQDAAAENAHLFPPRVGYQVGGGRPGGRHQTSRAQTRNDDRDPLQEKVEAELL